MPKTINCVRCGEAMQESTLTRHVVGTYQGETVVCENVPVQRCGQCGQIVFFAPVAELLEQIRKGEIKPDHMATLEVGAFAMDRLL